MCQPISGNASTNLRRDHFPASPDLSLTDETSLASYLSNYRAWESTLPSPVQEDATSQVRDQILALRVLHTVYLTPGSRFSNAVETSFNNLSFWPA